LFIASCHEKFILEKQESYRRFQEMMARSMWMWGFFFGLIFLSLSHSSMLEHWCGEESTYWS
jgi:hypothetical protein